MVDVIPALLVGSKRYLEEGLERLRGVSVWVQVDFVGSNYMEGEESFPLWEEFNFEADLMVPNQAEAARAMVELGAARIIVHRGPDAREALELLKDKRGGEFGIEAGIALGSADSPEALREFEGLYDFVQVMGIEKIGSQNQPPDDHALELVRRLRASEPSILIQVDGAAAPRIEELVEAGASRLVIGGAIAHADNPKAAYKELYNRANGSER